MIRQKLIDLRGIMTQAEASEKLGITQKHLSKIELGKRNPSAGLMAKLVRLYGQPAEVLFPDIFLETDTPKRRIKSSVLV